MPKLGNRKVEIEHVIAPIKLKMISMFLREMARMMQAMCKQKACRKKTLEGRLS